MGTTSPYPTVARETVAHQREAVILENTSGWASFSKKYIAEAENKIHNKERKNVNFNSFLTAERALIKSFKDLLSLPNLKIRESLNKRNILKNRPSINTNCFI